MTRSEDHPKNIVSANEMAAAMFSFAIARVCDGESLLALIRRDPRYAGRDREPMFWSELYAFALFPVDYALSYFVAPDLMSVRRAIAFASFAKLSNAFAEQGAIWLSEHEWAQFLHDRFDRYGGAFAEVDDMAFRSVGMLASINVVGGADLTVALFAADTLRNSHRVLPSLIERYDLS